VLYFIKLGGSLITNKNKPHTARARVIARLAGEMAEARQLDPDLQLVVGHGSGSFGHIAGDKYHTRQGVHNPTEWLGFAEVWQAARALNQIVAKAMYKAGLPVIAFPPSAAILAQNGQVTRWDIQPIRAALSAGLIPLVNGDVAFDTLLGGTILSTEDLFEYLARLLRPQRILLAGLEKGVWADYPVCSQLIAAITPESYPGLAGSLAGSAAVDVTGGMAQKVKSMLALVEQIPGTQAVVFSGNQPGQVRQALLGAVPGTLIVQGLS
jgi:isopentenyl phosphate kinase